MNRDEKRLAKKLLSFYEGKRAQNEYFSQEENIILDRWRILGLLSEEAFLTHQGTHAPKVYDYWQGYPFTALGDAEIKKTGYMSFRNGTMITIVRDILTILAFGLSLYLTILEIFNKPTP